MSENNKGLIHIYCGDGKGKTTAAAGLSIRAAGNGIDVIFCQFMKGRKSGEIDILKNIENITVLRCDEDFGFYWNMSEETKNKAKECYSSLFKEAVLLTEQKEKCLVVFDEVTYALDYGFVDKNEFKSFIENRHFETEIVVTGRNPDDYIKEKADYITEMVKIKHPFDKGIAAREGIEY